MSIPLYITIEKRIENHSKTSICNSCSKYHMSFEINKELDIDLTLMHKSKQFHCESIETLSDDSENGPRFQNESLEGYNGHNWNMNA